MKEINEYYLAGLIDGDGCVYVHKYSKNAKKTKFKYRATICITISNYEVLYLIHKKYGGCLGKAIINKKQHYKTMYSLRFSCKQAIHIAKLIQHIVLVKKNQIDLLIELNTLKENYINYNHIVLNNLYEEIRNKISTENNNYKNNYPAQLKDFNNNNLCAYIAGLFDAEGCVMIEKNNKPRLAIGMKDKVALEAIFKYLPTKKITGNKNTMYRLQYGAKQDILTIINAIKPYSIIKKGQLNILYYLLTKPLSNQQKNKCYTAIKLLKCTDIYKKINNAQKFKNLYTLS